MFIAPGIQATDYHDYIGIQATEPCIMTDLSGFCMHKVYKFARIYKRIYPHGEVSQHNSHGLAELTAELWFETELGNECYK